MTNTYTSIDETFPVTGADNPAAGFRNNFYYIKESLASLSNDILTINHTLGMNSAILDQVVTTNSLVVNISQADYQIIDISGSTGTINVTVSGATDGAYYKSRLQITNTRSTVVNLSFGSIAKSNAALPVALAPSNIAIFDVWTTDGGSSLFVHQLGVFD